MKNKWIRCPVIHLKEEPLKMDFTKDDIKFAAFSNIDDWMELALLFRSYRFPVSVCVCFKN